MDLFEDSQASNLLPCDGMAHYHGPIFTIGEAEKLYGDLFHKISWQHDELMMFGKRITTARKVAWYGDVGMSYTYSGVTKQPLPWTAELLEIKHLVEKLADAHFNSCLLNLYHHGGEGMGWHADDEKSLGHHPCIASVSLGAARKFSFKHKQKPLTASIVLENGSLLVMKEATQAHWLHSIPKSTRVTMPRINLTFRFII